MQPLPQKNHQSDTILVLTHVPDMVCAKIIAEHLIDQHLAACVNIHAPCESIYRWQGEIEHATEIPLYIKTSKSRYDDVEAAIRTLHPYELPEIVYVMIDGGSKAYIQWITENI